MFEDAARPPERARQFPRLFRQGRSLTHFHSFYDRGRALPTLAKADLEPRLWMSLADAAARRLTDGDVIRIVNDRGVMPARTSLIACP